jgi:hypothetical protein
MRALVLTALMLPLVALAREPVEVDFRCLTSDGDKPIRLEWRVFSELQTDWTASYVKYKGAKRVIPLVLRSSDATETAPGRPSEIRSVWLEVVGGKISGEYAVTTQGANIYGFVYKNYRNGKEVSFSQDNDAFQESQCQWN